jgi:hypothetical protein
VYINNQCFYIARVPFETRAIVGVSPFTATPNTLELTTASTTYSRAASVNDTTNLVTITYSSRVPRPYGTFPFGGSDRGSIERADLSVNLPIASETFAQWALRFFGSSNIDPNADPDHDGATNVQEYQAGTDPTSNQSLFKFVSIQPALQGGIMIQWSSVTNKSYFIDRAEALNATTPLFTTVACIGATGPTTSYHDSTATGTGPYFYRLRVE